MISKNNFVVVLIVLTSSLGCSSFQNKRASSLQENIKVSWSRSTLLDDLKILPRSINRMQPVIMGDLVIAANAIDGISAYNKISGHVQWSKKISKGTASGVLLHDNTLYLAGNNGYFYSLSAFNGQVKWEFPIKSDASGTPVYKDGAVYFLSGDDTLYSFNAGEGKLNWRYNRKFTGKMSVYGSSQPLVLGNTIYVGFSDGNFVAVNRSTGSIIWEKLFNSNNNFQDIDVEPVSDGTSLFIGGYDDKLFSVNPSSGKINWYVNAGGVNQAVTLVADRLFYSSTNGEVRCLDKNSGKTLWTYTFKKGIASRPIVVGDRVFISETEKGVYLLNKNTGKFITKYETGRGGDAPLQVDSKNPERLFMISKNAILYSFLYEVKDNSLAWPWAN